MHTTVKFAKLREDAIIPSKREEDAGYDIYPCFDGELMYFRPHETRMIKTGICSAFDKDYVFILKERGSVGTKGIGIRAGVIDSGFRGEWLVPFTNHNEVPLIILKKESLKDSLCGVILPYKKAIAQALLLPVPTADIEEYTLDEVLSIGSKRGTGKLGSSGK